MKNIVINFSLCKYPMDMHNEIKEKLDLPEWYGNNLSALWDVLTGFIETNVSITVIFKLETKATEVLKENVLKIIETFKETAEEEKIKFNCDM